jgi:hypothetical protein
MPLAACIHSLQSYNLCIILKGREMLQRFFKASPIVKVLGHDIDKPRLTSAGWFLIFLYLALPFMLIGALFDFFIQLTTGHCVGVWCLFS